VLLVTAPVPVLPPVLVLPRPLPVLALPPWLPPVLPVLDAVIPAAPSGAPKSVVVWVGEQAETAPSASAKEETAIETGLFFMVNPWCRDVGTTAEVTIGQIVTSAKALVYFPGSPWARTSK
jgi:hypothetical protein